MQISRHWRLNTLRYRLQGVRYENGDVSIQERPQIQFSENEASLEELTHQAETPEAKALTAA